MNQSASVVFVLWQIVAHDYDGTKVSHLNSRVTFTVTKAQKDLTMAV
jgi:hypothetical protein